MQAKLSFPLLALFGLTRGLGGIGLGLLLADRLPRGRRKHIAKLLLGIGAATTVPLIATVIRRSRQVEAGGVMEPMTGVYVAETGTVDDAELVESPEQAEIPTIRP